MLDLRKILDCGLCPEETEVPVFYQLVHERGYPSREPAHPPQLKVIEGTAVENNKKSS